MKSKLNIGITSFNYGNFFQYVMTFVCSTVVSFHLYYFWRIIIFFIIFLCLLKKESIVTEIGCYPQVTEIGCYPHESFHFVFTDLVLNFSGPIHTKCFLSNTTITNRRQTLSTVRKSRKTFTVTRHPNDNKSKATSSLFLVKMIAKLVRT